MDNYNNNIANLLLHLKEQKRETAFGSDYINNKNSSNPKSCSFFLGHYCPAPSSSSFLT